MESTVFERGLKYLFESEFLHLWQDEPEKDDDCKDEDMETGDKSNGRTMDKHAQPVAEKQKAIVKPHILTHVIDGFVIQEGPEPFPVGNSVCF